MFFVSGCGLETAASFGSKTHSNQTTIQGTLQYQNEPKADGCTLAQIEFVQANKPLLDEAYHSLIQLINKQDSHLSFQSLEIWSVLLPFIESRKIDRLTLQLADILALLIDKQVDPNLDVLNQAMKVLQNTQESDLRAALKLIELLLTEKSIRSSLSLLYNTHTIVHSFIPPRMTLKGVAEMLSWLSLNKKSESTPEKQEFISDKPSVKDGATILHWLLGFSATGSSEMYQIYSQLEKSPTFPEIKRFLELFLEKIYPHLRHIHLEFPKTNVEAGGLFNVLASLIKNELKPLEQQDDNAKKGPLLAVISVFLRGFPIQQRDACQPVNFSSVGIHDVEDLLKYLIERMGDKNDGLLPLYENLRENKKS